MIFEVAFSIFDASGNHILFGHCVNVSGNISRKQIECEVSNLKSNKINFFFQLNVGDKNVKENFIKIVDSININ